MRHLIWWIRSWFCNHEWLREEVNVLPMHNDLEPGRILNVLVSATCTKCGWHHSYKKYGTMW